MKTNITYISFKSIDIYEEAEAVMASLLIFPEHVIDRKTRLDAGEELKQNLRNQHCLF